MTDFSIFLTSIRWRYAEPEHERSFDVMRRARNVHASWVKDGDALVDRSRSIVATTFLQQTEYDVLLMVDSDISFPVEGAVQICEQALEHDVVCGMYVTRGRGPKCKPVPIWDPGQTVTFGTDPTPVPIKWPGGGFLAIHRRVLAKMAEDMPLCHPDESWRFYPFFQPYPLETEKGWIYLSEDYAFGERAHDLGFGVYLNPAVRMHHWGVEPHGLEDMVVDEPPPLEIRMTRNGDGSYTRQWPEWKDVEKPKLLLVK